MRPLSLEESKQIVTEFLKYIWMYNEERVERYFASSPPPPPQPKKSIIQRIINFFIVFNPPTSRIILYNFYPTDKHIFSPHYEISNNAPIIAFEDDSLRLEFAKALQKTLKENNIDHLYVTVDDWEDPKWDKRVILLSLEDVVNESSLYTSEGVFTFSKDLSFLICGAEDDVAIFASQKLFSDFKKNYPNWEKIFF